MLLKLKSVMIKMDEKTNKTRKIGIDVSYPKESCNDANCPFHGNIVVKNRFITGTVVSVKMNKSAVITKDIRTYLPKFERYLTHSHRISVHNPSCLNVKEGDRVKAALTRPLSKTKTYVIVEVLKNVNGN